MSWLPLSFAPLKIMGKPCRRLLMLFIQAHDPNILKQGFPDFESTFSTQETSN